MSAFDIEAYLPPAHYTSRIRRPYRVLAFYGKDREFREIRPAPLADLVMSTPVLREALERDHPGQGDPRDGLLFHTSGMWTALMRPRYPHDVPWTALPHVGRPYWMLKEDMARLRLEHRQFKGEAPTEDLMQILSEVEHVVLAPGSGVDLVRRIAGVRPLEEFLGRELGIHVRRDDTLVTLDRGEIAQAEREIRADMRFEWAWHWNVGMLMPRLIRQAYHTRRPPAGSRIHSPGGWEPLALQALQRHPFALQMLYWVQRQNPRPLVYDRAVRVGDRSAILGGAGSNRLSGERMATLDWIGHGVESVEFDVDRPPNDFLRSLEFCQDSLSDCGLLVADQARWARLSPAGAELLRLLPPGCRDLGMPTRWVTPGGRIGTEEDIPAMDRWLTTVLRHIKKGANALQPEEARE